MVYEQYILILIFWTLDLVIQQMGVVQRWIYFNFPFTSNVKFLMIAQALAQKWLNQANFCFSVRNLVPFAVTRMERHWCCQSPWSYQPSSWFVDVGDLSSWSAKVEFWVVFLHPPTICSLCCLFGFACWGLHFHYVCWGNIYIFAWSVSEVLPITKDG